MSYPPHPEEKRYKFTTCSRFKPTQVHPKTAWQAVSNRLSNALFRLTWLLLQFLLDGCGFFTIFHVLGVLFFFSACVLSCVCLFTVRLMYFVGFLIVSFENSFLSACLLYFILHLYKWHTKNVMKHVRVWQKSRCKELGLSTTVECEKFVDSVKK